MGVKDFSNKLIASKSDISHTKFWSNIAYAVATWAFIYLVLNGRDTVDIWLVYLGTVAGHTALSKYLSLKNSTADNK